MSKYNRINTQKLTYRMDIFISVDVYTEMILFSNPLRDADFSVAVTKPISQLVFKINNVTELFRHQSEKCSVFSSMFTFNVVAMVRIRYNFRPVLPVEEEE